MQASFNEFLKDIDKLSESKALCKFLVDNRVPFDHSDILRWQWVWSVSALDNFIHALVRQGMIESFRGVRPRTKAFDNFSISLQLFFSMQDKRIAGSEWEVLKIFEDEVARQLAIVSFQHPDKISWGLSLIWIEDHKWQLISKSMGMEISDVREILINIITRRNCIVHEGDSDPLLGGKKTLSQQDTDKVSDFIKNLGNAIFNNIYTTNLKNN